METVERNSKIMSLLSVICPIYNEEKYIRKCIDSILSQDYPKDNLEILFVDGMSTDNTRTIVSEYEIKFPFIHLLDNSNKVVPYAMNIGIKSAKGDIIIRLDARTEYPTDYLSKLIYYHDNLKNAENVGGVCLTLPCNESSKACAIAQVLSNFFGIGNSYFRTGAKDIMKVDTVPFGCFNRSLFDKIGLYDLELIRNQDDELNGRIIENGGNIYLIPSIQIKYYARDRISKVRKMYYQYGLYKPLVNKRLKKPATLRQFFPLLFVLGLIFGGILSLFSSVIMIIYLVIILLYLMICLFIGMKKAIQFKRFSLWLLMPYVFLNVHLSYGWGYLVGLYKILFHLKFSVTSNH